MFVIAVFIHTVGVDEAALTVLGKHTTNTTSLPVPPIYVMVADNDEPRKLLMVPPSGKPLKVPVMASAPSLLTMTKVLPATGV